MTTARELLARYISTMISCLCSFRTTLAKKKKGEGVGANRVTEIKKLFVVRFMLWLGGSEDKIQLVAVASKVSILGKLFQET